MLELIKQAGVVGCGGAGFPTYAKLDCEAEYLIINAAECEPLLETDKYLLRHHADAVVAAAARCRVQIKAERLLFAIKEPYTDEQEAIRRAIAAQGLTDAGLCLLPNIYPAGDEQMIVYMATGRIVPPGKIPLAVKVVVSNVATMLCVADALAGKPFTHKYLTVTGDVPQPCLLHAPLGTPLGVCLEAAGAPAAADALYIVGGPMMGARYLGQSIAAQPVTKTTSGIIVLRDERALAEASLDMPRMLRRARSVCIQCQQCSELCPRHLLGHPLQPHKIMRKLAFQQEPQALLDDADIRAAALCCECGVCEVYACPMGLAPRCINAMLKQELGRAGIRWQGADEALAAHPLRDCRQVPAAALAARLGLSRYAAAGHPDICRGVATDTVDILLKQHIGAPAVPIVAAGDVVRVGDLIAEAAADALSVPMHSSVDGEVVAVGTEKITLRARRDAQ